MKSYPNNILPFDGEVYYFRDFFSKNESNEYLEQIVKEVEFRQDKIKMFGRETLQPRLVAWHGDIDLLYTYSNISMKSPGWTTNLKEIRDKLLQNFSIPFNSVLVNYYRDGKDYMSYHQDNEKELGVRPKIISVSFGVKRDFCFKHIKSSKVIKCSLGHGDLLLMCANTQECWKHSLPKRLKVAEPRLNLTFRLIHS